MTRITTKAFISIKKSFAFLMVLSIFFSLYSQKSPSTHTTEWEKMHNSKQETMDWFTNAKYGMFIHWGIYSVPAGVWKGRPITEFRDPHIAEWLMYAARIPRAEYAPVSWQFNPVNFNADSIVKLAADAGMKYLVITAKHHDGFAMYDSEYSKFDIMDASPFKRDIIAEMYAACKKQGIVFGFYYSQAVDWMDGSDTQVGNSTDPNVLFGANLWDTSPNTFEEYLDNKAYPQIKELLRKFPDSKMIWFDGGTMLKPEQSYRCYKIAYDIQPHTLINDRVGFDFGDYYIPGDNVIPEESAGIHKPWETVGTMNNSWGFNQVDHDWKSPHEILYWLVDVVSKGGNYMLNIGPKSDGTVPDESVDVLRTVGNWLKINGEAIYNTQKWTVHHEGPTKVKIAGTEDRRDKGFTINVSPEDFWFTQKGSNVYAISIVPPTSPSAKSRHKKIAVKSMGKNIGKIKSVEVLGIGIVTFKQKEDRLVVNLPSNFSPDFGYALKVKL